MSFLDRVACWSSRNVLDLHVDGRLTPKASARVDAHLEACASCRADLQALKPAGLSAGAVQVPPGLAEAILRQLEAGAAPAPSPAPVLRLAPAQAAALVYLAVLAAGSAAPGPVSQGLPGRPGLEAAP